MAHLQVLEGALAGSRFEQIFAPISGSIIFSTEGAFNTARFSVPTTDGLLTITYLGALDSESGNVHQIRVERDGVLWFRYGVEPPLLPLFSYAGGFESFHTSGNAAAAVVLTGDDFLKGSAESDYLEGRNGNDALDAGSGRDTLLGGDGNDFLDGGPGADALNGGQGDDRYLVDDVSDLVVETEENGFDTIFSHVSYGLSAGLSIEVLAAAGTRPIDLTGNGLDNVIYGNVASNRLNGGSGGADQLFGDGGADRLSGGDGADSLYGGMGNDTLIGGNGADTVYGDSGRDSLSGSAGTDTLYGGGSSDTLRGGSGSDSLYGDVANDLLYGESGQDTLYGGLGNNTLFGGTGRDWLYGSGDRDALHGGSGADVLFSDAGADLLSGGEGNDTLSGGAGRDLFEFSTALSATTNVDVIRDFDQGHDKLQLSLATFTALGPGNLAVGAFHVGAIAARFDDRIIHNTATGRIFYDPDGSGGAAQILFAVVVPKQHLHAADFYIV
jgi:serralysin